MGHGHYYFSVVSSLAVSSILAASMFAVDVANYYSSNPPHKVSNARIASAREVAFYNELTGVSSRTVADIVGIDKPVLLPDKVKAGDTVDLRVQREYPFLGIEKLTGQVIQGK